MKLISWNVNGLRAIYKKGFMDVFNSLDADIFCVQETKMQEGQIELDLKECWNILGEIIGETYTDELIDQIFSRFCLGK